MRGSNIKRARHRTWLLLGCLLMMFSVSVAMAKNVKKTGSVGPVTLKYDNQNRPIRARATFTATYVTPLVQLLNFRVSVAGTSGRCELFYDNGGSVGAEYFADGNARGLSTFFMRNGKMVQYINVSPSWSVSSPNLSETQKVVVSGGVYDGFNMIGGSVTKTAE